MTPNPKRTVFQRIGNALAQWVPSQAFRPAVRQQLSARRSYAAAAVNRLTEGWSTVSLSANADIHASIDALRARSRQLFRDDPYAKKFGEMCAANIVGETGFSLQARVYDPSGTPDDGANWAIETAFDKWSKVADVSGRQSLRDMLRTLAVTLPRDGEILIRFVRGKDAGNPFGFALQLLDTDRIDTNLNRAAEYGYGQIRMGVEINGYGRATHLWLKNKHPGENYSSGDNRQNTHSRISTDDLLHRFVVDRPEQYRGVPWMHASMLPMNNLSGYQEAAIVASRVGASKMGFFTTPDGDASTLADSQDESTGELYSEADAGSFGTLPPGAGFVPFNPDYPQAMFDSFVKANLRGIASGLGVAYHELANDLEGVSFSSIRSGTLAERDRWMMHQQWFIEQVLEPVYAEWLAYALSFGQVVLQNGSPLPLAKKEKFAGHIWQGRRWEWVDPLRDIQADIAAVDAGLQSPQRVAAKLGRDYEDLLNELKAAQTMREKIGIQPKAAAPQNAPA